MARGGTPDGVAWEQPNQPKKDRRYNVLVALNDEQLAATEGWRSAHGISSQAEALSELVRIGLLSEIAKIYRLVADNRTSASHRTRGDTDSAKRKNGSKLHSS